MNNFKPKWNESIENINLIVLCVVIGLFVIMLLFFKKIVHIFQQNRKWIFLGSSMLLIISFIIWIIEWFNNVNNYDFWQNQLDNYFIFNFAELCSFLLLFSSIALFFAFILELKNKNEEAEVLIKSFVPWMIWGSFVDKSSQLTQHLDSSFLYHTFLLFIGFLLLLTFTRKYNKKDYFATYLFILLFLCWVFLFAAIPYWVTGHEGFATSSTGFWLDPVFSNFYSPYYEPYNYFIGLGIPKPMIPTLFYMGSCFIAFLITLLAIIPGNIYNKRIQNNFKNKSKIIFEIRDGYSVKK